MLENIYKLRTERCDLWTYFTTNSCVFTRKLIPTCPLHP